MKNPRGHPDIELAAVPLRPAIEGLAAAGVAPPRIADLMVALSNAVSASPHLVGAVKAFCVVYCASLEELAVKHLARKA